MLTDEGNKVLKKKMPDECFIDMLTQGPVSKGDVDEKIAKDLMGRQGMITENVIMKTK